MFCHLVRLELSFTKLTRLVGMKFLIMIFLKVNIHHHVTLGALLNISAAVGEVAVDLGLRKHLVAVLAPLHQL